jgi:hypothetical protein
MKFACDTDTYMYTYMYICIYYINGTKMLFLATIL